jgi:hypothetical protein
MNLKYRNIDGVPKKRKGVAERLKDKYSDTQSDGAVAAREHKLP